jgi:hypothetical protein
MVTGAADAFDAAAQNRRNAGAASFRVGEYFMFAFSMPRTVRNARRSQALYAAIRPNDRLCM